MKLCIGCERTLSFSEFYRNKMTKDGYYSKCKRCRQEMVQRLRLEDKPARDAAVSRMRARGCSICGESDIIVIQLHHWPIPMSKLPWKRQSITEPSRGIAEFVRNVAACVPLCANCHLKFHAGHVEIPKTASVTEKEVYQWYVDAGGKKKLPL